MNRKYINWFYPLVFTGTILLLIGCKKEEGGKEENNNTNTVTVTDIDGNVYNTVTIGTQTWMDKNLRTTKLNDGTALSLVTDDTAWKYETNPAYCWYDNNEPANRNTYGALYNCYTMFTDKICPEGWHVATDDDWTILSNYLGGFATAGGKLKEAGTTHWWAPNTGATNETGFTALPGGLRSDHGEFSNMGSHGHWWSSTIDIGNINIRIMYYNNGSINWSNCNIGHGYSIRCLKD